MKILLTTDCYLPHAGGSRVYYHNLYKRLVTKFGDEVTVLTKKVPGWKEFDRQELNESLRIIRRFRPLPTWKYRELPKGLLSLAETLRVMTGSQFDLMACGDLYPQGFIGLLLKRAFGMPYLTFCHGEEVTQTDMGRYIHKVRDRIYQGADHVVAASPFAYQNLIRIGIPAERITMITPGVDCERFRPQPKNAALVERFGLQDKRVLTTVSRLIPRKGHDVILRAVAKLLPQARDVRYLIVGEGPTQESLTRLVAELGLANHVVFTGPVPQAQLCDYYNLGDIFVMANRAIAGDIEGFGMVFLEASAAGKPVVGGRSGGADAAIQDGVSGFLVNPEDSEELASTLRCLVLDSALCHRMADAGLRRVRGEFSWESRSQTLHELSWDIVTRALAKAQGVGARRNPVCAPEPRRELKVGDRW